MSDYGTLDDPDYAPDTLVFAHVGDLHLTNLAGRFPDCPEVPFPQKILDRQQTLREDLRKIIDEIGSISRDCVDFVYIPGDIAENGDKEEYKFLRHKLLAKHQFPLQLIPGDHDRQLGNMRGFTWFRSELRHLYGLPEPTQNTLDAFPTSPRVGCFSPSTTDANGCTRDPPQAGSGRVITQFYYSQTIRNVHCIFLDLVSAGYGQKGFGLDFRLGKAQMCWLLDEVEKAKENNWPCAVFMHCYPVDMADNDEKAALAGLFWNAGVRLVEMGHTHYNELAPDGRTAYAAARSVGQNEDGPVGYAVGVIQQTKEHGIVTSWRFKQLQLEWPFVLITSPADRRMATEPLQPSNCTQRRGDEVKPSADDTIHVRALVLTDQTDETLIHCSCQVDGGPWNEMRRDSSRPGLYHRRDVPWPPGSRTLSVRATDGRGYEKDFYDIDTIEPVGIDFKPPSRPKRPGSDDQAVQSWPVKGVRGDQAGPNRGRHRW